MKRVLIMCMAIIAAWSLPSQAQVIMDYNQMVANQNVRLRIFLQEEETEEPIGYASVYLTAPGDSTIAYFGLSDEKGEAVIKDIVPGEYEISAEMIGYMPYKVTKKLKGWEVNLGVVSMKEDKELLKAAKVSAAGNAIMVKGDTLIYNASAFNVNDNAMLEDLLKKMPGMEVDENGNVTVGGEKVDRITVGGKTFFLNDPSVAVKNLPAKIVEKISIIDKDNEEAEFTGISTKDSKEKVMDVGLKEEYSKGWFGNASVEGGCTIMPKDDNPLVDNVGALFNARGLLAAYTEKDQVTILGNGRNVDSGNYWYYGGYNQNSEDDGFQNRRGQTTSAQGGVNYNTDRIKNFETNVSANYNYMHKIAKEVSSRTSYRPEGEDLLTNSNYNGIGSDQNASVNFELKRKENKKFMFSFKPNFIFSQSERNIYNESVTSEAEKTKNSNLSSTISQSQKYTVSGVLRTGFKNFGKDRRAISLYANVNYWGSNGNSHENMTTSYGQTKELRNLNYDNLRSSLFTDGAITYVEPFGTDWSLMTTFVSKYQHQNSNRSAFNAADGSSNTYYSSLSELNYLLFSEEVLAQYAKGNNNLSFGVKVTEQKNKIYTRKLNIDNTTGENEWVTNWSPNINYQLSKDQLYFRISTGGWSSTPSGADITPALDITNPMHITTGNIFLKPEFSYYSNLGLRYNNRKNMTFFMLYLDGGLNTNKKVYASWFDENSVRYAIPVNSKKIGNYGNVGFHGSFPLDKKKNLSLRVGASFYFTNDYSYQSKSVLPGLDKENFDYAAAMDNFWGNSAGDKFYSGESGFEESRMRNLNSDINLELTYNLDNLYLGLSGMAHNNVGKYSLDPKANIKTWDFLVGGTVEWSNEKGWEIGTDCRYMFYRGYSEGFGKPEFIWNASISKSIKAFTISLKASDILNQRKSLSREINSDYMQDTYRNLIGRYVMIGLTFNFGKANAQNNVKAQNAMYQIAF